MDTLDDLRASMGETLAEVGPFRPRTTVVHPSQLHDLKIELGVPPMLAIDVATNIELDEDEVYLVPHRLWQKIQPLSPRAQVAMLRATTEE